METLELIAILVAAIGSGIVATWIGVRISRIEEKRRTLHNDLTIRVTVETQQAEEALTRLERRVADLRSAIGAVLPNTDSTENEKSDVQGPVPVPLPNVHSDGTP